MSLWINPGRVDWFLTAKPDQPGVENSTAIKSVGSFPDALDVFAAPMLAWLAAAPQIVRLAYGATLMEPVSDKKSGYERLSAFLPYIQIDPAGSEDFFYQINRPRKSAVLDNLVINRLSKWSVASVQHLSLTITPAAQIAQSYAAGEPSLAVRVELDINTAPDHQGELPHSQLGAIFREFLDLGSEIAARGDVA